MLHSVENMLHAAPQPSIISPEILARCIDACEDCAQICTACADACLGEEDVRALSHCIRLCLDTADICSTAVRVLTRQEHPDTRLVMRMVHLCTLVCGACAAVCEQHAAQYEHCGVCARVCRECEDRCCAITTC